MQAIANEFAPWLNIAHRYDGLRELLPDGTLNPTVREMFRNTRYPRELVNEKTPWCSAFACTVFEIAGVQHPHTARARDFIGSPLFVHLVAPVLGSLLVFERGTGINAVSDKQGHVTFCDRDLVSPHQVDVLCFGGNQDNAACSRRKKTEHLIASLWPKGWPLPPNARAA